MRELLQGEDRAQSEVLGFVFVFAMMVLTIAFVGVGASADLRAAEDATRVVAAEQSFVALAENLDEVAQGAPSRASELKLESAQLQREPTVKITVSGVTDAGNAFSHSSVVTPLAYDDGTGSKIVYANGAVIRQDRGGAVMVRPPTLLLDENRLVMHVIDTQTWDREGIGGTDTVLVRTIGEASQVERERLSGDVTVEIKSPRADVWGDHLSGEGFDCSSPSSGTVTCTADVDTVAVVETDVEVYLS